MITLLIWILVLVLIFGLVLWVVRQLPLEEPYKRIGMAIIAVIFVLILLMMLLGEFPMRPILIR